MPPVWSRDGRDPLRAPRRRAGRRRRDPRDGRATSRHHQRDGASCPSRCAADCARRRAGHARRVRRAVGPPAGPQHRARRQRRAGARHVAGADAAQLSGRSFDGGAATVVDAGHASCGHPARSALMKAGRGAVALPASRSRTSRLRRAGQAAPEPPRRRLGARRLRDGGRRHARTAPRAAACSPAPGSSPEARRRSTR